MKVRKITPLLAANLMGKAPSFVYIGLQRGLLPIGTALKKRRGQDGEIFILYFAKVIHGIHRIYRGRNYSGGRSGRLCVRMRCGK